MNDRQRLDALTTITRLSNWFQRTKLDPAEFVRRNRDTIDELLTKAAPPTKPPKPRRRSNRWRRWEDLRPAEQTRLTAWLRRRGTERAIQLRLYSFNLIIVFLPTTPGG